MPRARKRPPTPVAATAYEAIERLQKMHHLSLEKIARMAHIAHSTAKNIYSGKTQASELVTAKLQAVVAGLENDAAPPPRAAAVGGYVQFCGVCTRVMRSGQGRSRVQVRQGGRVAIMAMHEDCYQALRLAAAPLRGRGR